MPGGDAFQYAILRVVPRIERGECMNVGVVLYCPQRRFIGVRLGLDEKRLRAFAPGLEPQEVRPHLEAIAAVVRGEAGTGRLGSLTASERFGWVAAQSSTIIQPSEVHTGLTGDPERSLEHLFRSLVAVGAEDRGPEARGDDRD